MPCACDYLRPTTGSWHNRWRIAERERQPRENRVVLGCRDSYSGVRVLLRCRDRQCMMSGWSCYFVSCCALLYLLIQPQSTGELAQYNYYLSMSVYTPRSLAREPCRLRLQRFNVTWCTFLLGVPLRQSRRPLYIGGANRQSAWYPVHAELVYVCTSY